MEKRIKDLIGDIRSNTNIDIFDEATTKQVIILRMLFELGWKIFKADEVNPEYSVANRRVDYSLRINGSNKVFIEVKKVAEDLENHQKQLLDYSFQEGVELAVLTNGVTWWFYLPLSKGSWEQRKFFAIDIIQQEPEISANRFIEFLSRKNVETETAIRLAESMLKGRVKENEIKKSLPKAWNKIISEPDELLVELINETVEKICGHRAEREQIVSFISEYVEIHSDFQNGIKESQPKVTPSTRKIISGSEKSTNISRSLPPNGTICQFSYKGSQYNGIIKDGRFQVDRFGSFSSFSAASVEITKTSRNGWRDWEIKLPGDNRWQLANIWRKKHS